MRFSIPIILTLPLFLSCEEALEYNPLDFENNPEFVEPETTIIYALDLVSTSSMTITFEGNRDSMEFRYHLDAQDYSDWTSSTSAILSSLTEGEHLFRVQGRYLSGYADETPDEHSFTVDYIRPTTSITSPSYGATLNSTTAQIIWELETGAACSYNFNNTGWTDWASGTSATFDYLDEGSYTFSIKSRFDLMIEEESPVSINFEVDALQGPGIRVYSLLTEMSVNSTENVSIYAEEVEGLVVAKFQVKYNASLLSLDAASVSKGEMFLGVTDILFFTEEIGSGLLDVNLSVLGHGGVSGTGELVKLPFVAKATGTSSIEILNAEYSNITPSPIPILGIANGLVVIQ